MEIVVTIIEVVVAAVENIEVVVVVQATVQVEIIVLIHIKRHI